MGTITRTTMDLLEAADRPRVAIAPGPAPRFAAALGTAFAAWRRHRRIAAGIAAMRELDEHGLHDLGIDRGGIEAAARGGR